MKFSTREDVEGSVADVFALVTDFESFERRAMRRGAQVTRTDDLDHPGVGMTWRSKFRLRGKDRKLTTRMVHFDPPNEYRMESKARGLRTIFALELIQLSKTRTRMAVSVELLPETLSARLFVQSLKLAKGTLNKRFKLRVADAVKRLDDRLKETA